VQHQSLSFEVSTIPFVLALAVIAVVAEKPKHLILRQVLELD
jgi:hypothetical protein